MEMQTVNDPAIEERIRENKRMTELLQRPHIDDIEELKEKTAIEWQILSEHYKASWSYERDRRCTLDVKLTMMNIVCAALGLIIILMLLFGLLH